MDPVAFHLDSWRPLMLPLSVICGFVGLCYIIACARDERHRQSAQRNGYLLTGIALITGVIPEVLGQELAKASFAPVLLTLLALLVGGIVILLIEFKWAVERVVWRAEVHAERRLKRKIAAGRRYTPPDPASLPK